MNVLGISSNTYNILATLFKHIFDENEFAPRAYTLIKRALYLQWRRGRGRPGGRHGSPYCWDQSENCQCCRKLSENCQCCRKLSKMSTGAGWRFKMLSSGIIFGLSEKMFGLSEKYCPWPPPPKKTWVPRRHCLLNNTVILRSRACTFTVGCSHCHIQNSLQITKTSFKVPKKRVR
jgi:hypothetical protein